MILWDTRAKAILYLEQDCPRKMLVLSELFDAIDHLAVKYEKLSGSNTYARICGLTLLKAKNLAIGSYSLILDGLGQEAGVLLRPLIEYIELLTYFRHFPDSVNDVANDNNKLPSAGLRAKAINGFYEDFRKHLNLHASHSSYSYYALSHLLEHGSFKFKNYQRHAPKVLEKNIKDISIQIYLLLYEATLNIEKLNFTEFDEFADRVDSLKVKLFLEFKLDASEEK